MDWPVCERLRSSRASDPGAARVSEAHRSHDGLLVGMLFLTSASLSAPGDLSDSPVLLLAFGVLFALALSVTIASSVSLELIQHIESGSSPVLGRALLDSIGKNLLRALPIVFIWCDTETGDQEGLPSIYRYSSSSQIEDSYLWSRER